MIPQTWILFNSFLLITLNGLHAQFDSEAFYTLTAIHSRKILGVNAALNIIQWDYLNLDRQKWQVLDAGDGFVKIISAKNGYCIESLPDKQHAGNIRAVPYKAKPQQQWKIQPQTDGYVAILNRFNGFALDVMEQSLENGWILLTWEWVGGSNQRWKLDTLTNGLYKLTAKHSGKSLTMTPSLDEPGANVAQWQDIQQHWQQWQIIPATDGFVKFCNRHSGMFMQYSTETYTQKIDVEQAEEANVDRQLWKLNVIDPRVGTYTLLNKASNTYLEVMVLAKANGANAWTYELNGGPNQIFYLKKVRKSKDLD